MHHFPRKPVFGNGSCKFKKRERERDFYAIKILETHSLSLLLIIAESVRLVTRLYTERWNVQD